MKNVSLLPETGDYPAGGAAVQHFAAPGQVTLARLARKNGRYRLTIVPAEFVRFDEETMAALASLTTPQWPIAFARLQVGPDEFLASFPCNHIHGVYGDCVEELVTFATLLGMDYTVYRGVGA